MNRLHRFVIPPVSFLFSASIAFAAPPVAYQTGQAIEVREGDSWSSASVVRHEGRKFLVHYANSDASSDEWITADRMRLPNGAAVPSAPAPSTVTPPTAPAPGITAKAHPTKPGDMFPEPDEVIPVIEADRAAIAVDQPADPPGSWSVTAAVINQAVIAASSTSLHVPSANHEFHPNAILPYAGGAVVSFSNFGEKARWIERVGSAGNVRASLPSQSLPLAVSPSGNLLVCRCNAFGFGNNARIDAYTLATGTAAATPLVSFKPYPDETGDGKGEDVRFAAALSDKLIVTCDSPGRLVAWNIAANSAVGVWRLELGKTSGFDSNVALSPDRKLLAAATEGKITFIDPETGHVRGVIKTAEGENVFNIGFTPNGKTLAGHYGDGSAIISYDVATGNETHRAGLPANSGGRFCPVDDDFALVGFNVLIDTTSGAIVDQFSPPAGAHTSAVTSGATLFANDTTLYTVHIPDAATRSAAIEARKTNVAVKPGMEVAVDIQLDMSEADKSAVDEAIRKKLTDDGFKIVATADTVVICRTEQGELHEHRYAKSQFGLPVMMGTAGTSVFINDKITRLTIQQNGKTVWERKRISTATSFELKENQSIEDGAKQTVKYDPRFLETLTIPPYIPLPTTEDAKAAARSHRLHRP